MTNTVNGPTMSNIPETIGALKSAYTCVFSLEMHVFNQFRGSHKAKERQQLAEYITGRPQKSVNIIDLADMLRAHFDQLRLF